MTHIVSLKIARMAACQWKGTFVLIYAVALGLVQVVGETDKESSNQTKPRNSTTSGKGITDQDVASIITLAESVLGIIFNSLLLVVIYCNPLNNLRRSSWLTITNLALADLLTSIATIPLCYPVIELVIKDPNLNALHWVNVFVHIGYSSSFFLLLLFAIERYIAVKHPIQSGIIMTKKRIAGACILCWAAAIVFGGLTFSSAGANSLKMFIVLYGILEFTALLMVLFQVLIVRSINVAGRRVARATNREAQIKSASRITIILTLILIVTAFPYFISKQIEFVKRLYPHLISGKVARSFPYFYFPIACLNFIVNPLVYAWRLPDYRKAFVALFRKNVRGIGQRLSKTSSPTVQRMSTMTSL